MSFRIGLVGLCTSHPGSFVPIIRELVQKRIADAEIVAAWDSGETRESGYTEKFCREFSIKYPLERLEDMLPLVDGVFVHTTNWDRHIEQAERFVQAGKTVYIDKPVVGNMLEANIFLDWMKQGFRVTGGSVMRYSREIAEFVSAPESERGRIYTAYTSVGVDDFNYGIHGYALLSSVFGLGIQSVRYVGSSNQKHLMLDWKNGRTGILTVGKNTWLPPHITLTTDKNVFQIQPDTSQMYRSMLEQLLPYLTRISDAVPLSHEMILEPEFAAMAARLSWMHNGDRVFLSDLKSCKDGYDGTQFAREYRRARLGG